MKETSFTWDQWTQLPEEEKNSFISDLNPYEEHPQIFKTIASKFKEDFKNYEGVLEIDDTVSVYHGGMLVLSVLVQLPFNPEIPDTYQGLDVLIGYRVASKEVVSKLGEDFNLVGDILELNYHEIEEELKSNGLNFEVASKEEILSAVSKYK